MMICTQTFYKANLQDKTPEQIMKVIRSLKREIGRLKSVVEDPSYKPKMQPSEKVKIACMQDYLHTAKQAYAKAGGIYIPSAAEKREMELEADLSYISSISFNVQSFFDGFFQGLGQHLTKGIGPHLAKPGRPVAKLA